MSSYSSSMSSTSIRIRRAVEIVSKETGGKLNYLVNNAAQMRFMPLLDEDVAEVKRLFDVNVCGPLRMMQTFAPLLMAAKGTMVLISSFAGYLNVPWQGAYAASKRASEVMADTLRVELAPFHVKVVSVVTTPVGSQIHTHYMDWDMPEKSYYYMAKSSFTKIAQGDDGAPRMPAADYAKVVVSRILSRSSSKTWYGASASLLKFLIGWLPTSWMVCIWSQDAFDSNFCKSNELTRGTGIDLMLKKT